MQAKRSDAVAVCQRLPVVAFATLLAICAVALAPWPSPSAFAATATRVAGATRYDTAVQASKRAHPPRLRERRHRDGVQLSGCAVGRGTCQGV